MADICPTTGGQCALSVRVEELAKDVEEIKSNKSRDHTEIYGRLRALERYFEALNAHYETTSTKLTEVASDVKEIKDRPTKKWDTVVASIITGAVCFLLAKFGLST